MRKRNVGQPRQPDPPADKLLEAFHSTMPSSEIAAMFGIGRDKLDAAFERLRYAGLLPQGAKRRHTQGGSTRLNGYHPAMIVRHAKRLEPTPPRDRLVAAWHSDMSAREAAASLGISLVKLHNAWAHLRKIKAIPTSRRVHHRQNGTEMTPRRTHAPKPVISEAAIATFEEEMAERQRDASDRLLALLRSAHGPDGRPDLYPGAR